jgi:methionyl-tRNA formyltransferase
MTKIQKRLQNYPLLNEDDHSQRLSDYCYKIFKSEFSDKDLEGLTPGEYYSDGKKELVFQTGSGALRILELQVEGKRKLGIEEFLRGYKIH